MTLKIWADEFAAGQLSNTDLYQEFIPSENTIVNCVRTSVVLYNNPTIDAFQMKLYNSTLQQLIASSTNTITKAQIQTLDSSVKDIYFNFANVSLKAEETYNLVLNASSYVPTSNSHAAWVKAFPDPRYRDGITITTSKLAVMPYMITVIGDKF